MGTDSITIGRDASLTLAVVRGVAERQARKEAKEQRKASIIHAIKRVLFLSPARVNTNRIKR
jgi:hypothetical protein